MNIYELLKIELFNSILISIFFLIPLSKILNSEKFTFPKLFIIRLVILFLGNLINYEMIFAMDLLALCFGSTAILVISSDNKKNKYNITPTITTDDQYASKNKYSYKSNKNFVKKEHDYIPNKNLSNEVLEENGIINPTLFKDELYNIFITYLKAYSSLDYNTLSSICTTLHFHIVSNKLNYFEKTKEKCLYKNFSKNSIIIDDIDSYGYSQIVSAIIDIEFDSFKTDSNGNNYTGHNNQKINIIFIKKQKQLSNLKNCKNCGAPLNKLNLKCDYCGSIIDSKINWKINSIRKINNDELNEFSNNID